MAAEHPILVVINGLIIKLTSFFETPCSQVKILSFLRFEVNPPDACKYILFACDPLDTLSEGVVKEEVINSSPTH